MYKNDLIFREVPTIEAKEVELDEDDSLLLSTAEAQEVRDVLLWDQLLDDE